MQATRSRAILPSGTRGLAQDGRIRAVNAPSVVVIIPVKPPAIGKSRLAMSDDRRSALATAFALDTIDAAVAAQHVAGVLVVTDDHRFAIRAQSRGCVVVPDGVSDDLNASLVQAAHEARRRWPNTRIAVLCADVPALVPAELDEALAGMDAGEAAFVRDADGSGTTLYAAPDLEMFRPSFGAGSAQAHLHSGAVEVVGDLPRLRRDVDDRSDLAGAMALGVGAHTSEALLDL